ncbi:unnamed protein product [Didymodactylos carnosus]|uniref:16S rRNA (uracil(1498)-N(3))-methyltransferase n=1 Tax=Didymodactylos carnosus TaxID=1234261 RepID=A0A8S2D2E2_9BILA|nr:unnamed protein product [Didymodactylos carnosus]CAF3579990.1 unnamed protein product [Didymodactylos carnosus]
MSIAIFATGGKQYRASVGDTIYVEKLPGEKGEKIIFDEVLMVDAQVGTPFLAGAKVQCTIEKQVAKFMTNSLDAIAKRTNLSTGFLGGVLLTVCTSIPETITAIYAGLRNEPDFGLTNVVGAGLMAIAAYFNSAIADRFPERLNVDENTAAGVLLAASGALPEISSFVFLAIKGQAAIAIGGIVGSHLFNLALVFLTDAFGTTGNGEQMSEVIYAKDLRAGHTFTRNNALYLVLENSFNKTAMREGIVKCKVKNLRTGSITVEVLTGERLPAALVERTPMSYSYGDGQNLVFMNDTTFDQVEIPSERLDWEKNFLTEGSSVKVITYEDEVLGIELPDQVSVGIEYAEEGVQDQNAYLCSLTSLNPLRATKVDSSTLVSREPNLQLTFMLPIIKRNGLEMAVQKLTELGVIKIQLVLFTHSQPHQIDLDRLKRIAKEAAEQAQRSLIPEIYPPISLSQLPLVPKHSAYFAYERHETNSLEKFSITNKQIYALVGPEGGIEQAEIQLLLSRNYLPISLGKTILRAETAAIVLANQLLIDSPFLND